jgi:hypothetical protein
MVGQPVNILLMENIYIDLRWSDKWIYGWIDGWMN